MSYKTVFGGAALALTACLATQTFAAVGDPSGTAYGVSGRNNGHSDGGFGAGTFGYDLLFAPEYTASDLTGDDQLGPGGGAPLPLTFDGVAETFGNLEFNESHQIYDGSGLGIYSDFEEITKEDPLVLPLGWTTPAHLVELSMKDTLGGVNDQGGFQGGTLHDAIFNPNSVTRYDGLTLDGTTGGPNAAVPVFPADRPPTDPNLAADSLEGAWVGSYFYFKKDGMPLNPVGTDFTEGVLGAAHPNIPGQDIFLIITGYEVFDIFTTHDIGPGTFGVSWDLSVVDDGLNFIIAAGLMDIADPGEIDEIVAGYIYRMVADSDANEDGLVNGLDYLAWAAAFGTDPVENPPDPDTITPAPGRTFNQYLADFDSSGAVDGLDYLRWASEFGFVGDGSDTFTATVPEPSSLLVLLTGLTTLCGLARSRRRT